MDDAMMDEEPGESVVFTMPGGDAEFEGLEPGEKMTCRATIRKEEDGSGCLVAVNGATVEADTGDDESTEAESGMGDAIDESMAA